MQLISSGRWDNMKPENGDISTLKFFANVCKEFTSVDGKNIIRGTRIVISMPCRDARFS